MEASDAPVPVISAKARRARASARKAPESVRIPSCRIRAKPLRRKAHVRPPRRRDEDRDRIRQQVVGQTIWPISCSKRFLLQLFAQAGVCFGDIALGLWVQWHRDR